MPNPVLIKTFVAEAAITAYRVVKIGAADGQVLHAAANSEAMFAVADALGQATVNGRVECVMDGTAEVEYGGTVARGDFLTADSSGRAIASAPGAGVNHRIIGIALVSGVVGDIGLVQLAPGRIQG